MNIREILTRKRDGAVLSAAEIRAVVEGATSGEWADYQLSAFLMAVCTRGMDAGETAALTEAMMHSGDVLDLSAIAGVKTDKHSTGGVGDKVSIALAPLVACEGVPVPMISGRGLGHTGGTLDKLEAIPGFRTDLTTDEFLTCLERNAVALIGQTDRLAPADRKLYALRDVTGTVESIPLIVSSILSKKLAEGIDALVLDVKCGSGAFMTSFEEARELARGLTLVASAMGKKVTAFLTAMDEPLGNTIGNACEVVEAIELLQGRGPADLRRLTLRLGAEMLRLAGVCATLSEGERRLESAIDSGRGLEKFAALIAAQGGDLEVAQKPERLLLAPGRLELRAERPGFVSITSARAFGLAALDLGAGRERAGAPVDHGVGLRLHRKHGDRVDAGDVIVTLVHRDRGVSAACERLGAAFEVLDVPVQAGPLLLGVLRASGSTLVEHDVFETNEELNAEAGL